MALNCGSLYTFRDASISYHTAIKRIVKLPSRDSNHTACDFIDCLPIVSFGFQILNSNRACLLHHMSYLLSSSKIIADIINIDKVDYGVEAVFNNDL